MVRHGTTEDLYALKKLWNSGFSDPLNYIDFIFDRVADPKDIMIFDKDGMSAAMLVLLPVNFTYRDKKVKTSYIFGATTRKRFRGRGYMTHLLTAAEEEARRRGSVLTVLVPGEEYLYAYYRKRGYSSDFYHRQVAIRPGTLGEVPDVDTEIKQDSIWSDAFYEIREKSLADIPHIEWSEEQCRFVMDDSYIYGDHIASYVGRYGESYAVYNLNKNKIYVREVMGTNTTSQLVLLKELVSQNNPSSFTVVQPLASPLFALEGEKVCFGMSKPLFTDTYIRDLDGYMNLMLD